MGDGGRLIIGVNDDREVVGVDQTTVFTMIDKITNTISDSGFQPFLFTWSMINGLQISGKCLAVFIRNILQRISHLMNDTALILGIREGTLDGFLDTRKTVRTDDKDVFYTAILKTIQNGQPVLRTLVFSDFNRQNFFLPLNVDSENNIGCQLMDNTILPDRVVDCVDIQDRIDIVKRTILPFFNLWQDLVCNVRNKTF